MVSQQLGDRLAVMDLQVDVVVVAGFGLQPCRLATGTFWAVNTTIRSTGLPWEQIAWMSARILEGRSSP
jgi:hypothetical protein